MKHAIKCEDCGITLGFSSVENSNGHVCMNCSYNRIGIKPKWLEFDKPIKDCKFKSPIQDFLVYMTEPYKDVHEFADDELNVSLFTIDGIDVSMHLMGQTKRNLLNGEVLFFGLYVRQQGKFMLKISSPNHDSVFSAEFEVI